MHRLRGFTAILMHTIMTFAIVANGSMACMTGPGGSAASVATGAMHMAGHSTSNAAGSTEHTPSSTEQHRHRGSRSGHGGCDQCSCPCPATGCGTSSQCGTSVARSASATPSTPERTHPGAMRFVRSAPTILVAPPEPPPPRA